MLIYLGFILHSCLKFSIFPKEIVVDISNADQGISFYFSIDPFFNLASLSTKNKSFFF